jgi:hypothetical protein
MKLQPYDLPESLGTLSPNPWDLPPFPPEWLMSLGWLAPPRHSGR